jgi:hypothetical protein
MLKTQTSNEEPLTGVPVSSFQWIWPSVKNDVAREPQWVCLDMNVAPRTSLERQQMGLMSHYLPAEALGSLMISYCLVN